LRQQKSIGQRPTTTTTTAGVFEKARRALTNLGFRQTEARRAVAEVEKTHAEALTPEQALREALLVATAGRG
jgi:Holliday junction resolvasome RuvABC DNA-binding subunit